MKKSQDELTRLAGRLQSQAQTDIPAGQIRDQVPSRALPPATSSAKGGVTLSDDNPETLGPADPGAASSVSRHDHVHAHGDQSGAGQHAAADTTSGTFDPARLGSGTADNTTFLRGDSTWQAVTGGGIPAGAPGDMLYFDATSTLVLLEMSGVADGSAIYATDVGGTQLPFWDIRAPVGGASGDLSGTYPGPTVTGLRGVFLDGSVATPSDGDTLIYDLASTRWLLAPAGVGTVTSINITQPAAGITATGGPITSSGAITLALANDLAALEALSSTGLAVRTAADTWAQRTITGTSNRLSVSNGDGVSGNPTLDISTSYVGQASITTLGTIGTGAWQGTKIGLAYGGTNADLSATGGANQFLRQSSTGAAITVSVLAAGDIPTLTAAKISDFDTAVRTSTLNQMTAPTADLSINSHKLTNVTDPTADQDAATKAYVDAVAQGLAVKGSARLATAAALPSNTYLAGVLTGVSTGVLTVDGSTVALNDRILVKDEATQANNGLYVCTTAGAIGVAYVLTRTADMNAATEIPGAFAFVEAGTANAGAGFVVAGAGPYVVGTTAIVWTQFSGAGEITAGTGLSKTGNTLSISASYTGQNTITTIGTIATGTWSATAIDAAHGGTGQTSYAVGDLLYASASTTLSKLADVATGNVLLSGGVTTAPAWGKVDLTAHVSGILPAANGGTGINNSTRTLTISTNSGTLAFAGASKTLTIPDTGTAALIGLAQTFSATQTVAATLDSQQLTRIAMTSGTTGYGLRWWDGTNDFGAFQALDSGGATAFFFAANRHFDGTGWQQLNTRVGGAIDVAGDTLIFYTFPTSSSTPTSQMTITNTGLLSVRVGYQVGGTQVLTSRQTGWNAPTGTLTRGTFAVAGATTASTAQALAALITDLRTHGLINT